jgi:hypothetical protein
MKCAWNSGNVARHCVILEDKFHWQVVSTIDGSEHTIRLCSALPGSVNVIMSLVCLTRSAMSRLKYWGQNIPPSNLTPSISSHSNPSTIHFNNNLQPTSMFPKCSLRFKHSYQNLMCNKHINNARYMAGPSHPPSFHYANICSTVQIKKLYAVFYSFLLFPPS